MRPAHCSVPSARVAQRGPARCPATRRVRELLSSPGEGHGGVCTWRRLALRHPKLVRCAPLGDGAPRFPVAGIWNPLCARSGRESSSSPTTPENTREYNPLPP